MVAVVVGVVGLRGGGGGSAPHHFVTSATDAFGTCTPDPVCLSSAGASAFLCFRATPEPDAKIKFPRV